VTRYETTFTRTISENKRLQTKTPENNISIRTARAGLTIGQTGKMPGASHLNIKTLFYWFSIFLGCSLRVEIVELFDYCV